ncbi:MAG: helix-turn-helix transcriptional regulator [Treponema sp.]|nr:helix-turn-helix transcriptional regulator [Treponema sp.]
MQKTTRGAGGSDAALPFEKMKLKELRTSKNISIPRLSELTGIPVRTLEDIQKRGDCLVSNAAKIALALGVSLDELCA